MRETTVGIRAEHGDGVSSERPDNGGDERDLDGATAPRDAQTPKVPPPASPVSSGKNAPLPTAIPVPPRESGSDDTAGRWKVDPAMSPVASSAPSASSAARPAAPHHAHSVGGQRRVRGLLVPLVVCVVGLAVTIVVAVLTRPPSDRSEKDVDKDKAAAKGEPQKVAEPALPPPPPDELIAAVRQGDHHLVKHMLDRKADPNAAVGASTPIAVAVARGDTTAIKLLLAAGADANLAPADADPPLLVAIERTDADTVTALLAGGADVNRGDASQTPLMLAARKGSLPLVKLLLEHEADPNVKASEGDTPLMLAARYGREEIVAALVEAGSDVNAADDNGMTPLMHALELPRPGILKLLLEKGADPLARRQDGDSPLLIALTKNQWANYRTLDAVAGEAKPRLPGDEGPIPWKYLSELSPSEPPTTAKPPPAPPTVKEIDTPHFVWLAPPEDKKPGRAVYNLDRKWRFLQGFVALADSATLAGEQAVTFRIVGDGKELWKSAELSRAGDHRNFRIDVSEVAKLELFVDCKAAAAGADAIWVEPKLVN